MNKKYSRIRTVLTSISKQPFFSVDTFTGYSKLDYCNLLYYKLPNSQLNRLHLFLILFFVMLLKPLNRLTLLLVNK